MAKIKDMPRPAQALEIGYIGALGIQSYDRDNLYPQNVLRIVASSRTGSGCLERYKDFLEGDGLASDVLAGLRVNRQGETLADINALVCDDLATFDGFALHVNYTAEGLVSELHHVPFENVRLEEPDAEGVVERVAVHPDWSGVAMRAGKQIPINRANVDYIDVYNPAPGVVLSQIEAAGGIDAYKGQVLYVSTEGHLRYPLAFFDAVLTDMSTDEGLSNLMLRNARNNFLPAGIFAHYRSQGADFEDVESEGYSEALRSLQGDMNALSILDIECESKDDVPQFVPFTGRNVDKDFTQTDASIKEAIYSKFGQEAFLAVRLGKLGFSGTIMQEANDDYARRCVKRQKRVTRALVDIMGRWALPLPVAPSVDTLRIMPLTYAVATLEKLNN